MGPHRNPFSCTHAAKLHTLASRSLNLALSEFSRALMKQISLLFQHRISAATAALLLVLGSPFANAQTSEIKHPQALPADVKPKVDVSQCGEFNDGHYGPFDYRTASASHKRLVERWHFDMEKTTMLRGRVEGKNMAGTGSVYGGFAYTLKSFPNHPQA